MTPASNIKGIPEDRAYDVEKLFSKLAGQQQSSNSKPNRYPDHKSFQESFDKSPNPAGMRQVELDRFLTQPTTSLDKSFETASYERAIEGEPRTFKYHVPQNGFQPE